MNELDVKELMERAEGLEVENAELKRLLNTPEFLNFGKGVILEAAHQVKRWGPAHDRNKGPLDWFWLIGYLAQKVVVAQQAGDRNKALHHTISTAAVCANWHAAILRLEMPWDVDDGGGIDVR